MAAWTRKTWAILIYVFNAYKIYKYAKLLTNNFEWQDRIKILPSSDAETLLLQLVFGVTFLSLRQQIYKW